MFGLKDLLEAVQSLTYIYHGAVAATEPTPVARCLESEEGHTKDHHQGCHCNLERKAGRKTPAPAPAVQFSFTVPTLPEATFQRNFTKTKYAAQVKHTSVVIFQASESGAAGSDQAWKAQHNQPGFSRGLDAQADEFGR